MEHLRYALQAVLPMVLLLAAGLLLGRLGILGKDFLPQGDRLCVNVLLPLLIFQNIYNNRGETSGYLRCISFAYLVIAVSLVVGVLVVPRLVKNREQIPVLIQSCYRGNFTLYGLQFSTLLGGAEAAGIAAAMAAATLPVLNISGILMYAYYMDGGRGNLRRAVVSVLKNPIIWGVFLAFFFRWMDWYLPTVVENTAFQLADMATPFSFLLLGAKLRLPERNSQLGLLWGGIICKLVLMPLVFLPLAVGLFHLNQVELIPAALFLATPTAITSYQLAVQFRADTELAGNLVVLSTLLSAVTVCVLIYILRSLALI